MSTFNSFENLVRLCDNQSCIICNDLIQPHQEGCFLTVPHQELGKKKNQKVQNKFVFKWDTSKNVNALHQECWDEHISKLSREEHQIISSVKETLERFATYEQLQSQADEVAALLLSSRSTVCFTGAGISTSAGIPDYRGTAGIDNLADHQNSSTSILEEGKEKDSEETDYSKLQPTFAHRTIVDLNKRELIHYVITQNCDNLHGKAGLPSAYLSELHGNVFIEYCERCFTQYERDFCVDEYSTDCHEEAWYRKCASCGWNHYTGRYCEKGKCKGKLLDTIVNFGDDLHQFVCGGMLSARRKARHADVCLTLGTSLTVFPASDLPLYAKHLIICNLQATDLDDECQIRIFATCDDFFVALLAAIDRVTGKATTKGKKLKKKKKNEEEDQIIDLVESL
jgi:NAD+-dependent protein deacetylase sirtuin 6